MLFRSLEVAEHRDPLLFELGPLGGESFAMNRPGDVLFELRVRAVGATGDAGEKASEVIGVLRRRYGKGPKAGGGFRRSLLGRSGVTGKERTANKQRKRECESGLQAYHYLTIVPSFTEVVKWFLIKVLKSGRKRWRKRV